MKSYVHGHYLATQLADLTQKEAEFEKENYKRAEKRRTKKKCL